MKAALDELATIGEPVNRVLEVDLDGDRRTISRGVKCDGEPSPRSAASGGD
jgi:hypothetical protein